MQRGTRILPCLLAATAALALASPARAVDFEVTRTDDPPPGGCLIGDCSLREAVIAANAQAGADRILLPLATRYELTTPNLDPLDGDDAAAAGDLDVRDALTVSHPGQGRAIVDANELDRAVEILPDAPTTLRRVAIAGGAGPVSPGLAGDGDGGGIRTRSDLELVNSAVRSNSAPQDGGGIEVAGPVRLIVTRSQIVRNEAGGAGGGVAIDATVEEGLRASRVARSTFAGNSAGGDGGALAVLAGTARIKSSTLNDNAASKDGGGLYAAPDGRLLATNSTVTRNRAAGSGGGVAIAGEGALNAVTVARNVADAAASGAGSGGGAFSERPRFTVENSVLALNTTGSGTRSDCGGWLDSDGDNLITSPRHSCVGIDSAGDFKARNPKLAGLRRNGGQTKTIALRRGSPAVGEAGPLSTPRRDQRGTKRDDEPDIGAFELRERRRGGDGDRDRVASRGRG